MDLNRRVFSRNPDKKGYYSAYYPLSLDYFVLISKHHYRAIKGASNDDNNTKAILNEYTSLLCDKWFWKHQF